MEGHVLGTVVGAGRAGPEADTSRAVLHAAQRDILDLVEVEDHLDDPFCVPGIVDRSMALASVGGLADADCAAGLVIAAVAALGARPGNCLVEARWIESDHDDED